MKQETTNMLFRNISKCQNKQDNTTQEMIRNLYFTLETLITILYFNIMCIYHFDQELKQFKAKVSCGRVETRLWGKKNGNRWLFPWSR